MLLRNVQLSLIVLLCRVRGIPMEDQTAHPSSSHLSDRYDLGAPPAIRSRASLSKELLETQSQVRSVP